MISSEGSETGACKDEERDPLPRRIDEPEQGKWTFVRNEQNLPNANMGGK